MPTKRRPWRSTVYDKPRLSDIRVRESGNGRRQPGCQACIRKKSQNLGGPSGGGAPVAAIRRHLGAETSCTATPVRASCPGVADAFAACAFGLAQSLARTGQVAEAGLGTGSRTPPTTLACWRRRLTPRPGIGRQPAQRPSHVALLSAAAEVAAPSMSPEGLPDGGRRPRGRSGPHLCTAHRAAPTRTGLPFLHDTAVSHYRTLSRPIQGDTCDSWGDLGPCRAAS